MTMQLPPTDRKASQVTRKHWALIAAATVLPIVVSTGTAVADTPSTGAGTGATSTTCTYSPAVPADNFKGIPVFDARKAAKPYSATLKTSQGSITFQALTDKAPCTTSSFRFLAERDYFDRSHCHRLTTQRIFVLQCGDPTGTGSGGPGYSFPDENLEGATYPAGTVAMANAGPNTNGSQFFFVWKDTKLSPAYTPFGRITAGLDVLQKIAAGGEDDQNNPGDGFPTLPVNIRNVKISTR
ncbi:peptidylprolyl isomerase [Kitasatospora purpeofusca]|uniref:peptidylprolyl isomerase n=1 Tax=Kitasatospora purpeofusca TaxID=67352 RepID=UPI0038678B60|nr:peptidylprolyl isomerase [Kitasatospora purpeofusca]